MHSLVGVLLSRNIRAQQVAAAAIADICTAAPRMQGAFLAVSDPFYCNTFLSPASPMLQR